MGLFFAYFYAVYELLRKNMKKLLIPVVLGALALSTSAQALLVNVDFEESPFATSSNETSIFLSDIGLGVSLTITAFTIANDGAGNISSMTQVTAANTGVYTSVSGLGVRSNSTDGSKLDGGNGSDVNDPDEGLLFSFSEAVNLTYINFGSFGSSDDFNLTVDGVTLMYDVGGLDTNSYIATTPEDDKFNFSGIWGKEILIWADGNSDSFRIDDFTVSIPEPSIVALMGLGLFGMGMARRKQKR